MLAIGRCKLHSAGWLAGCAVQDTLPSSWTLCTLSEGLLICSQCCAFVQVHQAGVGCSLQFQTSEGCWPAVVCCMAYAEGLLMVRRYSKEVQGVLIAIERFKRRHCQESDELYYRRLRMMEHEEDWELR